MVMVQSSVAIFVLVFALASTDSISGGGCNISGGWHVGGHGHWAEVFQTSANGSFSATAFGVPHGGWHTAHGTYADSSGAIAIAYDSGRGTDQGDVSGCASIKWDSKPSWSRMPPPPHPHPPPPSPSPPPPHPPPPSPPPPPPPNPHPHPHRPPKPPPPPPPDPRIEDVYVVFSNHLDVG